LFKAIVGISVVIRRGTPSPSEIISCMHNLYHRKAQTFIDSQQQEEKKRNIREISKKSRGNY